MKHLTITLLLTLSLSLLALRAEAEPSLLDQAQVSTEWVVVFKDPRPSRLQGWRKTGYSKNAGDYRDSLELKRFGKKVASKYDLELRDEWLIQSLEVYCLVVKFNGDQQQTIAKLKEDGLIKWVQPLNEFELLSNSAPQNKNPSQITPLPSNIDGSGVVIAIIDSAVDTSHRDLAKAVSKDSDFVVSGERVNGGETHGTAIAGVIVAQRGSKLGVSGVAPAAKLESYRGCWQSSKTNKTHCNTLSLARALDAVTRSNASILNLSLSGPQDDLLDKLIQKLVSQGKMVIAAFDPLRPNKPRFPSQAKGVLVVRATDLDHQYSHVFSAPGSRVVAAPGNAYDFMHGHSVAAAYVSGILALRKQVLNKASRNLRTDWKNLSKSNGAEDLVREIIQNTKTSPLSTMPDIAHTKSGA